MKLYTTGDIARKLHIPLRRVIHIIDYSGLKPRRRVGNIRMFTHHAIHVIRAYNRGMKGVRRRDG